jgi:hypothetical protein
MISKYRAAIANRSRCWAFPGYGAAESRFQVAARADSDCEVVRDSAEPGPGDLAARTAFAVTVGCDASGPAAATVPVTVPWGPARRWTRARDPGRMARPGGAAAAGELGV